MIKIILEKIKKIFIKEDKKLKNNNCQVCNNYPNNFYCIEANCPNDRKWSSD